MPSNDEDISSSNPDLIGLPTHRVLRSLDAMPLPRASHDRLDGEYDALRVASLALSRPLTNETIVVASDIDGCGRGLIAIRNTPTSAESVDALRLTIARQTLMFGDTPAIAAVTVLSVLRQGFADVHDSRIDLLMREFAAARVSLDRWFCIDQQLKIVDVETLAVLPH
ncbi:MAG: hypothetical protein ACPGO8_07030 [Ilumatobacteraceae bacterium]